MNTIHIVIGDSPEFGTVVPPSAVSLLLGVDTEEVTRHSLTGGWSPAWAEAARRRVDEAEAKTGKRDLIAVLEYWAQKDHGANLRVDYKDLGGAK